MNLKNKRVGIWGYGVVGRSTLRYLASQEAHIGVYDQKELSPEQQQEITAAGAQPYQPNKLDQFLSVHDYLIPSGGIDLRPHKTIHQKILSELDLFCDSWRTSTKPAPIIGITGTVGKTSVTHLLSEILKAHGYRVATGGNIGVGLFDLLQEKNSSDYAVLELSSYQLDLCRSHAPDLAIITNLHPNHLDRHGSIEAYQSAKGKIFELQTSDQKAIAPLELCAWLRQLTPHKQYTWFLGYQPTLTQLAQLNHNETVYFYDDKDKKIWSISKQNNDTSQAQAIMHMLCPELSFPTSWSLLQAALAALGITFKQESLAQLSLPDHRFSCIATQNGISFYNDSKSTVLEATLAAVQALHPKPIILFLGGLSKGVDRASALAQFKPYSIKHVICFGKEADELTQACATHAIPASAYPTLEEAFAACTRTIATSDDHVLFSPAGASFDLFASYKARGERFKELVAEYTKS